jgi:putative hydrolase of the HAD superfamily
VKFHQCKAVLFDFGGTLDSDGEHWLDRFFQLYEEVGLDIPRSDIKRAFYCADNLCCGDSRVRSLGLRPLMQHHVRLQFDELNLEDKESEGRLVDGFCTKSEWFLRRNARLLGKVRQRYRTGLVSNFYGNVATLCEEAGLAKYLDVVLDSNRVGITKPDPEIFQMALKRLHMAPVEVLFVGDSYERDMIPARELGMKTVWVKGPNPRVPANAGPVDAWISNLTELEALIS